MAQKGWTKEIGQLRQEMYERGLHWCVDCEQFLPVEKFNKRAKSPFGLSFHCKDCEKERRKRRQRDHKAVMRQYHDRKKRTLAKLLGGRCQRCGYDEFVSGLALHHINPEAKEASLTALGTKKATEEADKCVLLCACCHFAYHAGEWEALFVKREDLGWTIKKWWLTPGEVGGKKKRRNR
jgi:hypothetical protein